MPRVHCPPAYLAVFVLAVRTALASEAPEDIVLLQTARGDSEYCRQLRAEVRAGDPSSIEEDPTDADRYGMPVLLQTRSREAAGGWSTKNDGVPLQIGDIGVLVARYKENTDWIKPLVDAGLNVSVQNAEGLDEEIAYLKHIVSNYDTMPEVSVFLHGGAPTDWHSPQNIRELILRINAGKLLDNLGGYANLNLDKYFGSEKAKSTQFQLLSYRMDCLWRNDLWVSQLRRRWQIPEEHGFDGTSAYCCSQFAVHREAVRAYPKEFWQSLLRRVSSRQEWQHSSFKTIGRSMDYIWHFLFRGGPRKESFYTADDFATLEGRLPLDVPPSEPGPRWPAHRRRRHKPSDSDDV